jgi:transposase InsO family protein
VFELIDAEKANHKIAVMCRVLGVSRSGYHAWAHRPPSPRSVRDAEISAAIRHVWERSRRTYGAPRVHVELRLDHNIRCGRKRVARLMRTAGIEGVHRRKRRGLTRRDVNAAASDDLVERDFRPAGPNRLWVADITQRWTDEGWLYLAVVIDAFSRRVVGWAMDNHLRTELVLDAFNMAVWNRRPDEGLVHHSDHGCQYTSLAFGRRLRDAGIVGSMGSVGDCYDNAAAESFFATLKTELLTRRSWATRAEATTAIFDYIEGFYNRRRRHSTLDYLSPNDYEDRNASASAVA